jgi:hypothetical protein
LTTAHHFIARLGEILDTRDWMAEGWDVERDDDAIDEALRVSEAWLRDLAETNQRVVQVSEPTPVIADSVDDALSLVFPHVIIDEKSRKYDRLTKWRLISDLQKGYRAAGLRPGDFNRNATLVASSPAQFTYPVDFVVSNGEAVQIAQVWSFQLTAPDALARDVKAWGWTIRELKQYGGSAHAGRREIDVPAEVPVEVVFVPPTDELQQPAFEEATGVFKELSVTVHQHGDEGEVAAHAAALLGRSPRAFLQRPPPLRLPEGE